MTEAILPSRAALLRMGLLACLGLLAVAAEAAPVGIHPRALPSPDLLALAIAVFAVRRPEAAAIPLVFALGLLRDLLTDLPTGLGALSLVIFAEALRRLAPRLARGPLIAEWLAVAGGVLAMLILQYLAVLVSFAQPPYLLVLARQWALTAAAWPLVFFALRWGLGIRPAPLPGRETRHAA